MRQLRRDEIRLRRRARDVRAAPAPAGVLDERDARSVLRHGLLGPVSRRRAGADHDQVVVLAGHAASCLVTDAPSRRVTLSLQGVTGSWLDCTETRANHRRERAGSAGDDHVPRRPGGAARARELVERGVRLVGIDYLSIGDEEAHHVLLGAGVVAVEGLDLREVEPGEYRLICAPLKLEGAEGAPARVLLLRD